MLTRTRGRRPHLVAAPALVAIAAAVVAVPACSVYDTSLLAGSTAKKTTTSTTSTGTATGGSGQGGATGSGGAAGQGGTTAQGGTGQGGTTAQGGSGGQGTGGSGGCKTADDCPGADSACATRTCAQSVCGIKNTSKGTLAGPQTKGTCEKVVCDGNGGQTVLDDDANVPGDDGKECTVEGCASGAPQHAPKAAGSACSEKGGTVCTAAGECVECVDAGDCASGVCDPKTSLCVAASCKDGKKNGTETDIDCGGGACSPCALGKVCSLGSDCAGGKCTGGKCAPTCTDGLLDGDETDVDCGGSCAAKCDFGQTCDAAGDCSTGACTLAACACQPGCACDHLVLSQLRSRGAAGAADEFIEIYNPTSKPVTIDSAWTIDARSTGTVNFTTRYLGTGGIVPAHGHFLVTGSSYAGAAKSDAALTTGIKDAGSARLLKSGAVIDQVCYSYNAATAAELVDVAKSFGCKGTPVSNLPHNDGTSGASNTDVAVERKPGGAAGNCGSTGDDATDWASLTPADPRNTASASAP